MDRQHGVHYLTDYYALLGLRRGTHQAECHARVLWLQAEIMQRSAARTDPEDKANAARMRVLTEADELLGDTRRRASYDVLLQHWDGPLSVDGFDVVDASRPYWTVYGLAGMSDGEFSDFKEWCRLLDSQDDRALSKARHNLNRIREKYTMPANLPPRLLAWYEKLMAEVDKYLVRREAPRRGFLELGDADAHPQHEYYDEVEKRLTVRRAVVRVRTDQALRALKNGDLQALGPGGTEMALAACDDLAAAVESFKIVAAKRFGAVEEELRLLAAERETLIEERLRLFSGRYLAGFPTTSAWLITIVRINNGSDDTGLHRVEFMAWRLDEFEVVRDDGVAVSNYKNTDQDTQHTLAVLFANIGFSVMWVDIHDGLPIDAAIKSAAVAHYDAIVFAPDHGAGEPAPQIDQTPPRTDPPSPMGL